MLKHLPNALTLLRLILAPVVAWLLWMAGNLKIDDIQLWERQLAIYFTAAAALFVVAALTDLLDGMAARMFDAESKFGRMIDPIADKALVGLPLIVLSVATWQSGYPFWPVIAAPTAIIVLRDVLMTVLRLTAPDGEGARVSALAKIKTALELFVIGSFLIGGSILALVRAADMTGESADLPYAAFVVLGWVGLLILASLLSVITAIQYLIAKPAKASP